jgi:hypothetical protein
MLLGITNDVPSRWHKGQLGGSLKIEDVDKRRAIWGRIVTFSTKIESQTHICFAAIMPTNTPFCSKAKREKEI